MRQRKSNSSGFVVGVALLCACLTVESACAAIWTIGLPNDSSVRAKTASVAGNGMVSASDGATAVFSWERVDPDDPFGPNIIEDEENVTAFMNSWSGALYPPQAGWHVSPKDQMGMPVGDHFAIITWAQGAHYDATVDHVVTD